MPNSVPRVRSKFTVRKAILIAVCVFLFWPLFALSSNLDSVRVISHRDEELFIFVNTSYTGIAGLRALLYAGSFFRALRYRKLQEDLVVYHLQGGVLKRYDYKDMSMGTPEIYKDQLYYEGGRNELQLWLWHPDGLKLVGSEEALRISTAMEKIYSGGFIPGNGWQMVDDSVLAATQPWTGKEKRTPFWVDDQQYEIVYHWVDNPYSRSFSLQGPGLTKPMQLLYHWRLEERNVSAKTYFSIAHTIF